MNRDLLYQLSLCQVAHIGHVHAKILCDTFGNAEDIFKSKQSLLESIEGIGEVRARSIRGFRDFSKAEKEITFIAKYGIQPLFLKDKDYPQRLLNCYDPPTLLFYKGVANINSPRIVSIVGTRNNSEYGKAMVEKLVRELSSLDVLIVSGLAFGIDSIAHKAAVKNNLPTIGVVGHGLDTIYPRENAGLAKEMLKEGGILSEFRSNTKPDKHNFPSRNRVVAGISDVTIIMESGSKGGSMITADIAAGYNRDVFALPGRISDSKSTGCNQLIMNNKAMLFYDTEQFINVMGWGESKKKNAVLQKQLFIDLSEDEKKIVGILREKDCLAIDELNVLSGISTSAVAAALLNLEMNNMTRSMPGKRYMLTD